MKRVLNMKNGCGLMPIEIICFVHAAVLFVRVGFFLQGRDVRA